jgi:hypothetical protein
VIDLRFVIDLLARFGGGLEEVVLEPLSGCRGESELFRADGLTVVRRALLWHPVQLQETLLWTPISVLVSPGWVGLVYDRLGLEREKAEV